MNVSQFLSARCLGLIVVSGAMLLVAIGSTEIKAQEEQPSSVDSVSSPGEVPTVEQVVQKEIRGQAQQFVDAFNNQDVDAIMNLWAEDGEYIDDSGRRFVGHDALRKGYVGLFKNNAASRLRVLVDSVRLLADHVAIEDGRAIVDPPPAGVPGFKKYTAIHIQVDGKWLLASVRDQHVETPSSFHNVADLEWLIGDWTAEDQGVRIQSHCRWIGNKSFVQRRYIVTEVDGTMSSGVQMVGWNPLDGHVQSWDFSPDGGHAVGIWAPVEGGWIAEIHGVTGEGLTTNSVNTMIRLDDNAYVWQSTGRSVGEESLPDTGEVILKRQTTSE